MSCSRIIKKYILNCGTTVEGESYTFSNDNVTGVGVFSADADNAVTFKGIASSGNTITITNDAGNKTVNLEINPTGIPALVPQATETVQGKIELATAAEVITGTDTERAVTVAGLVGRTATTLRTGLVRIATNAETLAGALTTVAVSPAGLTYYESFLRHPVTFANAGTRGAAVPAYVGQLGVQQDTGLPYVSTNTVAGAWSPGFFFIGATMFLTSDTTVDANAGNLVITDTNAAQGGLIVQDDGHLKIGTNGNLDFTGSGRVLIGGTNILANRLIGTSGTAGQVQAYAISSFFYDTGTTTLTGDTTVDASGGSVVVTDTGATGGGLKINTDAYLYIEGTGFLDISPSATVSIGGTPTAAFSFVGTGVTPGGLGTFPFTDFIGAYSADETYTITNDLTSRTFDADTVTTAQLADVVATLIRDYAALTKATV